ncbi:hypothetical protein HDU85_007613 [Gaertneriomyces sp. JEL0708]|nr:hypothetical protein HDU85_007613 [Gaertneriomyces sp. JEL0708]
MQRHICIRGVRALTRDVSLRATLPRATSSRLGVCRLQGDATHVTNRGFGTSGPVGDRESFPFQNAFSKFVNPYGYIKWKMNRIDCAREGYEMCAAQYDKMPELIKEFNLPNNFQTWYQITLLHIWMFNARLRVEGLDGKEMKQELFDHIWLDVELKLHQAGVKSGFSKIMTNLVSGYYGASLAYDEGLYYGDAILAAALWRNILDAQGDATQLERLLIYVRKQLKRVEEADRSAFLEGKFTFDGVKL